MSTPFSFRDSKIRVKRLALVAFMGLSLAAGSVGMPLAGTARAEWAGCIQDGRLGTQWGALGEWSDEGGSGPGPDQFTSSLCAGRLHVLDGTVLPPPVTPTPTPRPIAAPVSPVRTLSR
jgi:hypothetical protein